MNQKKPSFSLKDELFNEATLRYMADHFHNVSKLTKDRFIKNNLRAFPNLELKQRIEHIARSLDEVFGGNYEQQLSHLLASLPPKLDPQKSDDDFGMFIISAYSHFIVLFGLQDQYVDRSLEALREITMRFSSEFALRHFLNTYPDQTLTYLDTWVHDENYHVRRLVSEGTRPRLPWGASIDIPFRRMLAYLDILFVDKTRYVTRSVANHMNDISKLDPKIVIQKLKMWKQSHKQNEDEMNFIITHSLRTLLKQSHMQALELCGYAANPRIKISNFILKKKSIQIGEAIEFSFTLRSLQNQQLIVDYVVDHPMKNGAYSSKVFSIKKMGMKKDEVVSLKKRQPFREMTTKKLYKGEYKSTIRVNGKELKKFSFKII